MYLLGNLLFLFKSFLFYWNCHIQYAKRGKSKREKYSIVDYFKRNNLYIPFSFQEALINIFLTRFLSPYWIHLWDLWINSLYQIIIILNEIGIFLSLSDTFLKNITYLQHNFNLKIQIFIEGSKIFQTLTSGNDSHMIASKVGRKRDK